MIQMNIHPVPDLSITWSDFAAKLPDRMSAHSSVVYKDNLFVSGGCNEDQDVYSDCIHEVTFNHLTLLNCYPRCLNQEFITTRCFVMTEF